MQNHLSPSLNALLHCQLQLKTKRILTIKMERRMCVCMIICASTHVHVCVCGGGNGSCLNAVILRLDRGGFNSKLTHTVVGRIQFLASGLVPCKENLSVRLLTTQQLSHSSKWARGQEGAAAGEGEGQQGASQSFYSLVRAAAFNSSFFAVSCSLEASHQLQATLSRGDPCYTTELEH